MSFLASVKLAKFASALLAAAGFNLDELFKAGSVDALKAAIAALPKPDAEAEAALSEAVAANESLTNDNSTLKASLASKDAELKAEKDGRAADKAAHEAAVAKHARELPARPGIPPVAETAAVQPKANAKIDP